MNSCSVEESVTSNVLGMYIGVSPQAEGLGTSRLGRRPAFNGSSVSPEMHAWPSKRPAKLRAPIVDSGRRPAAIIAHRVAARQHRPEYASFGDLARDSDPAALSFDDLPGQRQA